MTQEIGTPEPGKATDASVPARRMEDRLWVYTSFLFGTMLRPLGYVKNDDVRARESHRAYITVSNGQRLPQERFAVDLPGGTIEARNMAPPLTGYALPPTEKISLDERIRQGVAGALFVEALDSVGEILQEEPSLPELKEACSYVLNAFGCAKGAREHYEAIKIACKVGRKACRRLNKGGDLSDEDKTLNKNYLKIAYAVFDAAAADRPVSPQFRTLPERLGAVADLMQLEEEARSLGESLIADNIALSINDHAPVITTLFVWRNLVAAQMDMRLKLARPEKVVALDVVVAQALEVAGTALKRGNFEAACELIEMAAGHCSGPRLDVVAVMAQEILQQTEGVAGLDTADAAKRILDKYDPDSRRRQAPLAAMALPERPSVPLFDAGRPRRKEAWIALV
ncbi:MAG: hypothetical protein PHY92_06315 [Alphaproteobacteria bacterium]|nr:hypothetical protein [Alphaproteobacteria bacterium]